MLCSRYVGMYLLRSVDWTLLWFLYSSFQLVLLFTKSHYETVSDLSHNNDASQQQVHRFHKNNSHMKVQIRTYWRVM